MKRKFLLIILFISIILGSIFIYDKNKMSNISENLEYSNDQDVREFINKVKVLYKSSDRKNVIKALGDPNSSKNVNTISMYQLKHDFYHFDNAIVMIAYHNNRLESASWMPQENSVKGYEEFIPIELKLMSCKNNISDTENTKNTPGSTPDNYKVVTSFSI